MYKRFLVALAFCVLGALCASNLARADEAAEQAASARFLSEVKTFSAVFEQVQTDEAVVLLSEQGGQLWLARPGRFRWSFETPYPQLMLSDGENIWLYDPDLEQATVRPARAALSGTPAELLTQNQGVLDQFRLEVLPTEGGASGLRLIPRDEGDFQSVDLWLRQGVPQKLRFRDQLGGETTVRFSEIKVNPHTDAEQFKFDPPQGTEVIESQADS